MLEEGWKVGNVVCSVATERPKRIDVLAKTYIRVGVNV